MHAAESVEAPDEPIDGESISLAAISDVEQALLDVEQQRKTAKAAEREKRWRLHREFVTIVARDDLPHRKDRKRLAEVIAELGMPVDEARREVEAIHKIRSLLPKVSESQRNENTEAVRVAREHLEEVKKRHAEELAECESHLHHCESESAGFDATRTTLRSMYSENPHLFDTDELKLPSSCRCELATRVIDPKIQQREFRGRLIPSPREIYVPGDGWQAAVYCSTGWKPIAKIEGDRVWALGDPDHYYSLYETSINDRKE